PFVDVEGARDEIWALGLRNPHRLSWDVDPQHPEDNQLIVTDIGLHTWEEVNLVHAGANYGYSEREGNQRLLSNNTTATLSRVDEVPVRIDSTLTLGTITPEYPVVQYAHDVNADVFGDAIAGGFVYRGSRIPTLQGKFVFGDISTGQLFYSEYDEMVAADDGDPFMLAEIHSIDLLWDDPSDGEAGESAYASMFPIVESAYHARGGQDPNLPGSASATFDQGRADVRLAIDDAGELYMLSKSDGFIRAIVGPTEGSADFNGDGVVDGSDLLVWQRGVGGSGGFADGDANADGVVDGGDFAVWSLQWGAATSSAQPTPEPSTAMGAAALTLAACSRRRISGNGRYTRRR
ncbi:MAG: PQQ-dependent sugar dehydrogenase, partial [Planctomycetales bacterium]|nr:PQQ-dependent sugar dehydrogenase [Planctomycetales bacterium]